MTAETVHPIRGSTAYSAIPGPREPGAPPGDADGHRGRRLGAALRAIGVLVDTAFRVVVLGTDGTRQPEIRRDVPPRSRPAG